MKVYIVFICHVNSENNVSRVFEKEYDALHFCESQNEKYENRKDIHFFYEGWDVE